MNCIKDGKFTGDSCFGCEIKAKNCEIYDLLSKQEAKDVMMENYELKKERDFWKREANKKN